MTPKTCHRPGSSTLRPVALAVALLLHGAAGALPEDPKPTFGQTQVTRPATANGSPGKLLRIDQSSAKAGIDWGSFSIGAGETVQVVQPGPTSLLVNRVTGLDPSVILGRLDANGRVFLTNPRGVIFGAGAQVDVGGLVATTLKLGDADAQAGLWRLQPATPSGDDSAAVVNDGSLRAPGGTIVLAAPQVINRGSIEASRVGLAAASAVQVDLDGDGLILFNARAADAARLDQLGRVVADGGRAELQALARGQVAGTVLNLRGAVFSRGLVSRGGDVVIDGGTSGIVEVGAAVDVSSAAGQGGAITVLGQKLLLDNTALLDASGRDGGGRILVGGGFQGRNPALHNAERVTVLSGARLNADAQATGDGGQVVVWSDGVTLFNGQISAAGAGQSGRGGFVETSGKQGLGISTGSVRFGASAAGQWLLDPTHLTVDTDGTDNAIGGLDGFTASGDFNIHPARLVGAGNITLQAVNSVTITSPLALNAGQSLTVATNGAASTVTVNAAVSTVDSPISIDVSGAGTISAGTISSAVGASINAGNSTVSLNAAGGAVLLRGALTTTNATGSAITINADNVGIANISTGTGGTTTLNLSGRGDQQGGTSISAGGLVKSGSGTLTLSEANTYTGPTVVNAGGLTLAGGNAMANTGAVQLANVATAVLTLSASETIGSLAGGGSTGGNVVLGGNALTVGDASSTTYGGVVSGTAAAATDQLIKQGSGTLTLTGASTYTGATAVIGGALALAGADRLPASTAVNVAAGATLSLSGDATAASLNLAGTLAGTGRLTAASYSLNGGTASANLGPGTLTANGLSAIIGTADASTVAVQSGTLTLASANRSTGTPAVDVNTGATLVLGGNETFGALGGDGTVALGNSTLSTGSRGSSTFAGVIAGNGGLTQQGSPTGTLTLTGNNTFTGTTTVTSGILQLGDGGTSGSLGSGPVVNNATLRINRADNIVLPNVISGSGALALVGTGRTTLEGANTFSGDTTVSTGILEVRGVGASAGTGTLALTGSTLDITNGAAVSSAVTSIGSTVGNSAGLGELTGSLSLAGGSDTRIESIGAGLTLRGVVSDASGSSGANLVKSGSGRVTLAGANSYAGSTTVQAGTLVAASDSALGSSAGDTTVSSGATLRIDGVNIGGEPLRLAGSGVQGDGALQASGSAPAAGTVTLLSDASIGGDGDLNLAGTIGEASPGRSLTKLGSGTLLLSGANSYTGTTHINAGTLALGTGNAIDSRSALEVDGGTLDMRGSSNALASVLLRSGVITGTGGVLSSGSDFDLRGGEVSAVLGGAVGLKKSSAGTVTLSRANAYSGATNVEDGALALGASNVLPDGTALTVNGRTAALNIGASSDTVASVTLKGGGAINGGTGVLTSNSAFDLQDGNITAILAGVAGATKTTAGTVTLAGANTYRGETLVNAGTLLLEASGQLNDADTFRVASGANFNVDGTERIASLALAGTLGGPGTLIADSYALSNARVTGNLGSGAISANGNNTITGQLAANSIGIDSGTLTLAAAGRFTAAPDVRTANGTQLTLAGNETIGKLTGSGSILLGASTLSTGTAESSTFDGVVSGSGGLTKQGSGTLTLSNAHTYTGATAVNAGTLRLPAAERLSDSTALTVAAGATLDLPFTETVASLTLAGTLSNSGTLVASNYLLAGGTATANLGQGSLRSTGNSFLNGLSGASTVAVNTGVLTLGAANRLNNSAALDVANGAAIVLNGDETVGTINLLGRASGLGTLSAGTYNLGAGSTVDLSLGSGTLDVNGNTTLNRPAGATQVNVNAGTLLVAASAALAPTADVTVGNGAALNVASSQTVGTLTLAGGTVGGAGFVQAARLRSSGDDATVATALTVNSAVAVDSGTLTVGNGATAGSLTAPSTAVNGLGVLNFNRSDGVALGDVTGDGTLRQSGGGTLALAGNATGLSRVQVTNGNLALATGAGSGDQLSNQAVVDVASNATLTLGAAGESVGTLALSGRLVGSAPGSTLVANTYALTGGTADANLGSGSLTSSGSSTLNATAAVTAVTVTGGALAVSTSNALIAVPSLTVHAGGALALTGSQQVRAVNNAGTLSTGSTLVATEVNSPGAVTLGGAITTSGNQTYGGALGTAVGAQPSLVAGGDISALNAANDFGSTPLALQARSAQLLDGGANLTLGTVALSGGSSRLSAQGPLLLRGKLSLAAGELVLESLAPASNGAFALSPSGAVAVLFDSSNGAANLRKELVYANPVISQTSDATLDTAAGSTLRLRAPGGGSIELQATGNQIGGDLSAITLPTSSRFVVPAAPERVRISRIAVSAAGLNLVKASTADNAGGGTDALRADVVQLSAGSINTAAYAAINARLPYSVPQGANSSLPGLVIDTRPAGSADTAAFGTPQVPIHVQVAPAFVGGGGLYLSVLPGPLPGTLASQVVYLGCAACTTRPIYQYGGNPAAVQAYYNGGVLGDAPLAASAINNSTTLLENARRSLFEATVRTENVAPRLRAGVIAEVGQGRPAVEGSQGARRPAQCEPVGGTLACGDTPAQPER